MKIDFRCRQCDQRLRAAKSCLASVIVCPACQQETYVPDPAVDSLGNWYDEHAADFQEYVAPGPVWAPCTASIREIFRDAWVLYQEHVWTLLAVSVIDLVLWALGLAFVFVPAIGTFAVLWKAVGIPPPISVLGMFVVLALGIMALINAMICSHAKFYLKIARGESATILDAFHIGWKQGAVTMLPTVFTVMCLTGFMLCVVPGVVVYLLFWPYVWVWADRQTGENTAHAFPMSRDLTSRNLGTSCLITLIGVLVTLVGFKVFGQSLTGVLKAVAYLRMSGQPVGRVDHAWPSLPAPLQGVDPA